MGGLKRFPVEDWADLDNGNGSLAEDTYLGEILEVQSTWLSMSDWNWHVNDMEKSQMTTTFPTESGHAKEAREEEL